MTMKQLRQWGAGNIVILGNAASLFSTTAVNSGLGFAYWWAAARLYTPEEVGLASAAVSAMMLLGNIGIFGLGTVLISEIPKRKPGTGSLIITSMLVTMILSTVLGVLFALGASQTSGNLEPLGASFYGLSLFAGGVSLTAATMIIDQAMVGFLRSSLQLWRNTIFAASKLGLLVLAGVLFASSDGLTIYATWALGNLLSILIIAFYLVRRGTSILHMPRLRKMRALGVDALLHHLLNLALQAPILLLPVMVAVLVSAEATAAFYAAWMVANFVLMVPTSLTIVLHAVGSGEPALLAQKMRLTMGLSLLAGVGATVFVFIFADFIMRLFDPIYAELASWSLRILVLTTLPFTFKIHHVTIHRVENRIGREAALMTLGGLLEVAFAWAGAIWNGLTGLSLGLLLALIVQAALTMPEIYRRSRHRPAPDDRVSDSYEQSVAHTS